MDSQPSDSSFQPDGSPIFDNFDIDLVMQVLANTAFSPFFLFFIPVFYFFQGFHLNHPTIVYSSIYWIFISLFWLVKWCSKLYRNQGSLIYGPGALDWSEQIVIITGGSSGIGELLANTLAVRNVTVVVLDIKPIATENYNIAYYKCDVSKWDEVEAVSKKVLEEIGEPTMIVNNAGVVQGKLILDLSAEDINQTFGTNTLSHFWILKAFLPSLLKRKSGHIVTMSSSMGMTSVAQMSPRLRYNCPQIRTTLVCPGHVLTSMFQTVTFPTFPFFKFLAPSVQPVQVVKRIIAALDDQHSQTVLLPFFVHFIPFTRQMPSFLRDFAQWVSGADYAMESFVKISGRRPDEGPHPSELDSKKE
ncbi:hypothetical protein BJ912DRAFT_1018041 [Pholiota molesta]|nr:hypothetical protein BJ912DRAFT_1018041 [Pholiota molesta]